MDSVPKKPGSHEPREAEDVDIMEVALCTPEENGRKPKPCIRVASGGSVCTDVSYIGPTLSRITPGLP